MTQTRLNDTQLVLLSTAAQREDGSVLPLPDSLAAQPDGARKAIAQLLRRRLIEEAPVMDPGRAWREEEDQRIGLAITDAGRLAIGVQETEANGNHGQQPNSGNEVEENPTTEPRSGSKAELVLNLLRRSEGATLDELMKATGWLPHTTRAALTGLRKKGHVVEKSKRGEATCYWIAA
jgi:hypothetical protein